MFKLHKLESGPSLEVDVTREEMVKMYRQMSDIKELENKAGELYKTKTIRGFLHRYNGQVGIIYTTGSRGLVSLHMALLYLDICRSGYPIHCVYIIHRVGV